MTGTIQRNGNAVNGGHWADTIWGIDAHAPRNTASRQKNTNRRIGWYFKVVVG